MPAVLGASWSIEWHEYLRLLCLHGWWWFCPIAFPCCVWCIVFCGLFVCLFSNVCKRKQSICLVYVEEQVAVYMYFHIHSIMLPTHAIMHKLCRVWQPQHQQMRQRLKQDQWQYSMVSKVLNKCKRIYQTVYQISSVESSNIIEALQSVL